jgi:uncharacterized Ntn-hydrolase superfamily protein
VTLSVLGLDRSSGQIGVASTTHGFAVGARVPWARPGVGVAVTQAMTQPSFGPALLQHLAEPDVDPRTAISRILASDPGAEHRQLALVDVAGGQPVGQQDAEAGHRPGHASAPL